MARIFDVSIVVYLGRRLLKGRKAVLATRVMAERFEAWRAGRISFGEFDASVQGWVNHARYGDTWGLRERVLGRMRWAGRCTDRLRRDKRLEL